MPVDVNFKSLACITALGTATPKYTRPQVETADLIINALHLKPSEKRLLKSIYKATGIDQRHSVLSDYCRRVGEFEFYPNTPNAPFPGTAARMKIYKECALDLSIAAIDNAFCDLDDLHKTDITHLITVSCTGMYAPGLDIEIVQRLQLHTSTKRTAINFMGCYGAINALKAADAICRSHEKAIVLMVCVEICTIHFQKTMNLDNIIANSIFSDGAAAVLIQSRPTQHTYLSLEKFHNDLIPQTSQEMAWHIGDTGFDISLSTFVPDIIYKGIQKFIFNLLNQHDLTFADIDFYAIHPGGLKILEACEAALNISKNDNQYSYQVLRQYGNMSSATIIFILKEIWETLQKTDHQKNIFSCAFGPGLTLESMLLKVSMG